MRAHADVCTLGRLVTRVCAMSSAVVARLNYFDLKKAAWRLSCVDLVEEDGLDPLG
jgi:hypothetical protein